MPNYVTIPQQTYRVTAEELSQIVLYFESLEAQRVNLSEEQKELLATAKARGYDVKIIRKMIARRKRDREDVAEEDALLEMYEERIGA